MSAVDLTTSPRLSMRNPLRGLSSRAYFPLLMTCVVFLLIYTAASLRYRGFFSLQVAVNLIGDNAFLGSRPSGLRWSSFRAASISPLEPSSDALLFLSRP